MEDLLGSPYFLFGSAEQIAEMLHMHRDRYGISYFTLFGEQRMDGFAPVLKHLEGK